MLAPGLTIQVERFDIRSQLTQGLAPALLMKRDVDDGSTRVVLSHARSAPDDEWYILHEKLSGTAEQPHWSINRASLQIVIPLFDYLLRPDPNPEMLVHFGAQTGALATLLASRLPPDCFVTKMLLAIGNVFTRSDGQQGFQVWAGFAARVEKRGG